MHTDKEEASPLAARSSHIVNHTARLSETESKRVISRFLPQHLVMKSQRRQRR
jgi:hypothetical protein